MQAKEILQKAKSLIQDPKHWTRGMYQETTVNGKAYCALGAVDAAIGYFNPEHYESKSRARATLFKIANNFGFDSVIYFNDSPNTTHADILNLFDLAIADCKD